MGLNHGAVDTVARPIARIRRLSPLQQRLQDPPEDASCLPAVETAGHGTLWTIALRQITLGRSRAEAPRDTIQDGPVVMSGATPLGGLRREQRLQLLRLGLGQVASSSCPVVY
jgi:hypothetical protein